MRYIVEFSDGNGGSIKEDADEGYVEAVRVTGWGFLRDGGCIALGRDTDGEKVTLYRYPAFSERPNTTERQSNL